MSEKKGVNGERTELTCIRCPIGCMLTVTSYPGGEVHVEGNTCARGEEYGRKELTNPTRIVTTIVKVRNGKRPVVSVKTKGDIPKGKIEDCMKLLKGIEVEAPVRLGDVVLADVGGTGVDVTATKSVERKN